MQTKEGKEFDQLLVRRPGKAPATDVYFRPRARETELMLISAEKAGPPLEVTDPAVVVFDDSDWNRRRYRAEGIDLDKGGPQTFAQQQMRQFLATASVVILNTAVGRRVLMRLIRLMVPAQGHLAVIDTSTGNSASWVEVIRLARGGSEDGMVVVGKVSESANAIAG